MDTSLITSEVVALVVNAAITLIVALVTALLATAMRFLRAKLSETQFVQLQAVAAVAVSAAEQLGLNDVIEDKKGVAIGIATRELNARGIKVTEAQLDAAIEAAVLDAFNYARATEPETVEVQADFPPAYTDTTGI